MASSSRRTALSLRTLNACCTVADATPAASCVSMVIEANTNENFARRKACCGALVSTPESQLPMHRHSIGNGLINKLLELASIVGAARSGRLCHQHGHELFLQIDPEKCS